MFADFYIEDNVGKSQYFQKTFFVANTKFEVILKMFFLKFSNADISFNEKAIMWKFYTTNKVLPTTKRVRIINKTDFAIAVLDISSKTFIVYVAI